MVLLHDITKCGKIFPKISPKRFYSQKNENDDSGYMLRRLASLAEESRPLKDDPKAGKVHLPDEPDKSTTADTHKQIIDELYAKVENSKYEYLHQEKIAYTKIPNSAPKQAREIAESAPWTGKESLHDANLRMLVDAHKPLKPGLASGGGSLMVPKFKPPPSASERLFKARESSLDYSLSKDAPSPKASNEETESGPSFKEMYKERLLGPSGIPSTFSAINSLASQRIEDAIARGQFKDLPRGKPFVPDHHTSSPYIDTTEYFLNKIIQRQGAAPPWIEKQIKLNTNIDQLRKLLNERWQKRAVLMIVNQAGIIMDGRVNRVNDSQVEKALSIAARYSHNEQNHAPTNSLLRDNQWLQRERKYHLGMINDINNIIRGYNLQAPGSARKGYLDLESELNLSYQTVAKQLPILVKKYLVPQEEEEELPDSSSPVGISKEDLHKQSQLYIEDPDNHYGLSHLVRDVVARVWKKR